MQGDIVTSGSTCGINGCQRVTVTHNGGGDMAAQATLLNPNVDVSVTPKDNEGLTLNIALVCKTNQGQWEYLMVNEGEIVLIDGEKVMVKRGI